MLALISLHVAPGATDSLAPYPANFSPQVLENLLLAAKLRLPVTGKGQGVSAAAWRAIRRQRHREVHKVVGEVMALMALSKVATTVRD